ncbi:MAG: glycoside hydrolase family 127 protein [Acidobacteria bacterium]|nr:glycoside hydrolase family 127 protein [Acidobacteriota bacterium]
MLRRTNARELRRWMLCGGALFILLAGVGTPGPPRAFAGAGSAGGGQRVAERVRREARDFDLADVRLLDGPFKRAMALDAEYLLQLDPDRLLSWFRKEAGLKPKGAVYGGWEAQGIAGHSLGHYLTACSMMYAATGDARFRQRVGYVVDELERCQKANGGGYVAAIPGGKKIFREVAAGDIRSKGFDLNGGWVPWYTMHKLFAGLLDAHRHCASAKALAVVRGLADWAERTTAGLTDEQFQRMLAAEHGGMNESLAELYARTGDERYLRLSRRFHHRAVLDPLARREDRLAGLHANTQIPKVIGLARVHELTGDMPARAAAEFFWERVVGHHSYVIGGNSEGEHFGPPDKLDARLGQSTCETCNTYNMLKLTRHLFTWRPAGVYADYYERALYNHILASQNPEDGMFCYFVPLKPGAQKTYSTPYDSFWCCVGTGMENHARYGEAIYFRGEDALWVNLFIPSELRWKERGLTLRQETHYPDEETVRLSFDARKPTPLALRVRYPAWATEGMTVSVNGRPQQLNAKPGGFVEVRRVWRRGDQVELKIPMSLRLEAMPDNPNRAAVLYGPTVLAGELGLEDEAGVGGLVSVPVMVTENRPLHEWIRPVEGRPSTFRTTGAGRPRDVTLYAFHRMHGRRYTVYWDLFTPREWSEREAEYKAEVERARRLEALTVDFAQPGEMQPERDHRMQGERTEAGEHSGRKWRHARDGGWVSFELKVMPREPVSLVCTYWGSETGPRNFDILVDGVRVATQSLQNDRPGQFFDVTYPIPVELTRGREKVTVRFQARPGNTAGGLYGLRVVRGNL